MHSNRSLSIESRLQSVLDLTGVLWKQSIVLHDASKEPKTLVGLTGAYELVLAQRRVNA